MKTEPPDAVQVTLVNQQRDRSLDRSRILRLVEDVLAERGQTADVVIHWVSRKRSAELNQQFLQHEGPTDIITFDYGVSYNSGEQLSEMFTQGAAVSLWLTVPPTV